MCLTCSDLIEDTCKDVYLEVKVPFCLDQLCAKTSPETTQKSHVTDIIIVHFAGCIKLISRRSFTGIPEQQNRHECFARSDKNKTLWICRLTFNPSPLIISREACVDSRSSQV